MIDKVSVQPRDFEIQKEIEHWKNKLDKGITHNPNDIIDWYIKIQILEAKLDGILFERERITKILEEHFDVPEGCCLDSDNLKDILDEIGDDKNGNK